jgi:integrase
MTPHHAALRFMLLTLARREEVCSARWCDVDFDKQVWTIKRTKNGSSHAVPLSRQAGTLLAGLKREASKPADLIFATSTGGALSNWDRSTKAVQKASGTAGWHRHDLRRTGATLLGQLNWQPHVIEAALNHAAIHSQLAATYNRSRYRDEVRQALQGLADLLDGLVAQGAEIVPLRRQAG